MLDLVARHGGFDLKVKATGDLDVDQHHTVEDTGIALGEAVAAAIGNKRGINRAGYFVMPMDETLAVAAIDLSGRPHAVIDTKVTVRIVGDLQTELVARFLRRLRDGGARQRAPQGDVRPLEPSQDRSVLQGVRARAARGVLERQAPREDAAEHQGPAVIALVDYGAGNLTSVRKALAAIGANVWTPSVAGELGRAHGIIVPGVGHFDSTRALTDEWRTAIQTMVDDGVPLLGICVGLQWLFEGSDEAPGVEGLGAVQRDLLHTFTEHVNDRLKVPHVGWNSLALAATDTVDGRRQRRIAGLLHALLCGAGHRRHRRDLRVRRAVQRRGRARQRLRRSSSIRRSRATPGLRILSNWLDRQVSRRVDGSERRRMLSKRIIACLDVRDGKVVKGVNFEGLRDAGDPAALARRYNVEGIDEIVILDVTATLESRQARAHTIAAVAREIFLPLAVGGGIRSEDDAAAAIEAGADKVSLNTAALGDPALITTLAKRYGSQAVIVAIDAKRAGRSSSRCTRAAARPAPARDAVEWAREATDRGAGEILLTSIDRDGTKAGFDCEMTAAVSDAVNIPVIASGGAGTFEHFADVFSAGHADAALAASIFHFNEKSVSELKQFLADEIPVRLTTDHGHRRSTH